MVVSNTLSKKIITFLREMDASGVSAYAPEHMISLPNEQEDAFEEEKVEQKVLLSKKKSSSKKFTN